jgi:hypothetical protein
MLKEIFLKLESTNQVPESSYIVIADVRKSTEAIKKGFQREVNMVGAACIAVVRNNFPQGTIPYVFGGDGATFLVPDVHLKSLTDLLEAVQTTVRVKFKLSLRVGAVSVAELRSANADVFVRSEGCGEEEEIYFLQGNGLTLADKLIKERDSRSDENSSLLNFVGADLSGLSCRMLPFHSLRGSVFSFIVDFNVPTEEQHKISQKLFSTLAEDGDIERFRPVQKYNTRRKWLPKSWLIEAKLFSSGTGRMSMIGIFIKKVIENIFSKLVFKFNIRNEITGLPSEYSEQMLIQSDWVKFNGALYLILDMNPAEEKKFCGELELLEKQGLLFFGLHKSSSSLVICHLNSESQKKHFHFVDGSDGGLTFAAIQLKSKKMNFASAIKY